MKRRTTLLACTAILTTLAACGGSSTRGTSIFSVDAGTPGQALEDGRTLTAQDGEVVALDLNYDNDTSALADATFQLVKNTDGELTMRVNGTDYPFDPADRFIEIDGEVYGYEIDEAERYISLFAWRGTLDEALDPDTERYAEVWNYYVWDGTEPNKYGFAVVGTETKAEALAGMPTATYTGRARLNAFPDSGEPSFSTSRTVVRGDVEMTADFGAGTIAGQIDNLETRPAGGADFAATNGTIAMNETAITGNSFAGTTTPDADLRTALDLSDDTSGTYAGRFYGPNAEEVAGTLTISGADGSGSDPFSGIGFFYGVAD